VIAHELRRFDIATFRVATAEPLPYRPGQSVSIESPERSRIWRSYSPANVPRDDLTMDFHVRMLDGGALSSRRFPRWLIAGDPLTAAGNPS